MAAFNPHKEESIQSNYPYNIKTTLTLFEVLNHTHKRTILNAYTCIHFIHKYSALDWKSTLKNEWSYIYIFLVNLGIISLNLFYFGIKHTKFEKREMLRK